MAPIILCAPDGHPPVAPKETDVTGQAGTATWRDQRLSADACSKPEAGLRYERSNAHLLRLGGRKRVPG